MNRSIFFFLRASSRLIYLPVAILLTFSVYALAEPVETTVSHEQPEAIEIETQSGSKNTVKNKNHTSDKNQDSELSSAIVPKIQPKTNTENTDCDTENPEQITYETNTSWWSLTLADSLTALFTCLVAIFTGILAHATKKMWRTTKQTASAAEKSADAAKQASNTAIRAERAQIFIDNFTLKNITPTTSVAYGKAPTFHLDFEIINQGRSPGSNVRYEIELICDENFDDLVAPEKLKSIGRVQSIRKSLPNPIAPHMKSIYISKNFTFLSYDKKNILPADVWNNIKDFSAHLFLYGFITYDDIFGESHKSPFGYMFIYREEGETTVISEFIPLSHPDFWHYT
ncbi:MAG: hypothetical protein KAT90_07485 [Gammaproteobacteria bacterium]|nr:hypothetical protein [Gammaproteobacteria bacterium]